MCVFISPSKTLSPRQVTQLVQAKAVKVSLGMYNVYDQYLFIFCIFIYYIFHEISYWFGESFICSTQKTKYQCLVEYDHLSAHEWLHLSYSPCKSQHFFCTIHTVVGDICRKHEIAVCPQQLIDVCELFICNINICMDMYNSVQE